MNEFNEPFAAAVEFNTRDAIRVSANAWGGDQAPVRFAPRHHELIGYGLAVFQAQDFELITSFQFIRIPLWDDFDRIAKGRLETSGSAFADLEDRFDVFRVSFARRFAQLFVAASLRERVGNPVMAQIIVELSCIQRDLAGLRGNAGDISSLNAGLKTEQRRAFPIAPIGRGRIDAVA